MDRLEKIFKEWQKVLAKLAEQEIFKQELQELWPEIIWAIENPELQTLEYRPGQPSKRTILKQKLKEFGERSGLDG